MILDVKSRRQHQHSCVTLIQVLPVCSICVSGCSYCCPACRPPPSRRFPYWLWKPPARTIGSPWKHTGRSTQRGLRSRSVEGNEKSEVIKTLRDIQFPHIQTFDSVNLGLATTVRHLPLLKRSRRVAFYVRRNELGVCQWQPVHGGNTTWLHVQVETLEHYRFRHAGVALCTLRMKSGGVPGLTVGLKTPSWWEWISVSSRSRTRIFLFTASKVD